MSRIFELRTYVAAPGKMPALEARFRDSTVTFFEKHGMEAIGFWRDDDSRETAEKLVYLLAFPDRSSADASWESFKADPEWIAIKTATDSDGKLVANSHSIFMTPTDYSAMS